MWWFNKIKQVDKVYATAGWNYSWLSRVIKKSFNLFLQIKHPIQNIRILKDSFEICSLFDIILLKRTKLEKNANKNVNSPFSSCLKLKTKHLCLKNIQDLAFNLMKNMRFFSQKEYHPIAQWHIACVLHGVHSGTKEPNQLPR